jgi:DNA-binding NtrC family response regulator
MCALQDTRQRIAGAARFGNQCRSRFHFVNRIEYRSRGVGAEAAKELGGVTVNLSKPTDEFIADNLVGCTLAEVERALVLNTLAYVDGNRTQAAMALGISVRCLRDKIRRLRTLGVTVPPPAPDQRNQAAISA